MSRVTLPDEAYARLLTLRTGLRHFERWSEQQARAAGLTPAQRQLLLAVRGHGDRRGPTIGELADYLLLRHHSVVGLVDRVDEAGLVVRSRDTDDNRVVRVRLTPAGAERLERAPVPSAPLRGPGQPSRTEPSGAIGHPGLCATSQGWPSGSTNTAE